jgi:hypothetical protein
LIPKGKVIYLPAIYDPKKIREGILEILNLVKTRELDTKVEGLDKKEVS